MRSTKGVSLLAPFRIDPGQRGLAHHPTRNLFTATESDFDLADQLLRAARPWSIEILTGFFIPTAIPPSFETDGPPGALFLQRVITHLGGEAMIRAEEPVLQAIEAGWAISERSPWPNRCQSDVTLRIAIERAGPGTDGECRTMRGRVISQYLDPRINHSAESPIPLIAIGDGGNELGMGSISSDVIAENILNGAEIHCRVPASALLVVGVSNWGAYALAAAMNRQVGLPFPPPWFSLEQERDILEAMVKAGPLVDGVSGRTEATVDGLEWSEYAAPIQQLLEVARR